VNNGFGVGRKVIRDGIRMLEARYMQRDSQFKQGTLENRIKRLVFEEQRAKKLTDIANEKAEKLLKARDRHQQEMEDKLIREQERIEELERRKERNRIIKQQHME
jgi:IS5 family transposase